MERKIIAGFDREQIDLHHQHPASVVVTTSTFPVDADDPVPRFVLDQVTQMAALDPNLRFYVLIPHHSYSDPIDDVIEHSTHTEIRYHYFWPRSSQRLAGRGILPALRSNPLRYALIPFFMLAQRRALRRLCQTCDAKMIYAHWYMPQGVVAQHVAKQLGIGLMFTTHASDVSVLARVPLAKRLIAAGLRQANCFTAVSKRTAHRLITFFSADEWHNQYADKLHIIPMGTDSAPNIPTAPTIASEMESMGIDPDQRYILSLGRLSAKKGLRYLIDAYHKLPEALRSTVQLVIAGDGELAPQLKQQVVDLNLEARVRFTGFVQGEQKRRLLASAAVFALPSIIDDSGDSEGLPVALMEALAAGRMVIATDVSGAEEVLTDDCGVLVPQRSAAELATALQSSLSLSNELRAAQQQQARDLARQFKWPDVAERHLRLIHATLAANQ
ncbi:MAG: glycosyltransferase [Pseudomonadota bacterium]